MIAAKLAVSRRKDSCGEAYEQSDWIWQQHYRKAEHVSCQWRTRTQRYFLQEKLIVWEGVLIRRCQQPQHSDNLRCMLDTCNTCLRPHKKMDIQVPSFETLIFCSSFSSYRHPNTMFRQISLNQTRPQNWVTDGLPRTQLIALLSNLISQMHKKCNTVDKNWETFWSYIALKIVSAITNILQRFFWIYKTWSMRLQLTFYWNVTHWQVIDMLAGNTNDW